MAVIRGIRRPAWHLVLGTFLVCALLQGLATSQAPSTRVFTPQEFTRIVSGTVAQDIAITPKGGWVYIVGSTTSPDYPVTSDAYDRTCGTDGNCNLTQGRFGPERRADVVLSVFDATGQLRYSTFLGGSNQDDNPRLAIAPDGTLWLAGSTGSPAFEHQTTTCAGTTWIAQLDFTLRTDVNGNLYVTGHARSGEMPVTAGAIDSRCGSDGACDGLSDAFVAKFTASGAPIASTYYGGAGLDMGRRIAVQPSGQVLVVGTTQSPDFPLVNAQPSRRTPAVNFEHAFLAVFDDRLERVRRSGFVLDDQYLPNVAVLATGNGFAYVAAQVTGSTGLGAGIGTYLRAIQLP